MICPPPIAAEPSALKIACFTSRQPLSLSPFIQRLDTEATVKPASHNGFIVGVRAKREIESMHLSLAEADFSKSANRPRLVRVAR